jgi:hypothetical protein
MTKKKYAVLICLPLLAITSLLYAQTLFGATCTGADPCHACKNCHYCKHCAKEGGKCGVCKNKRQLEIYRIQAQPGALPPTM